MPIKMILVVAVLLITACNNIDTADAFVYSPVYENIIIFTRLNDYNKAPLEIDGVHMGIYLPRETGILNGQIAEFEELTGIPHSIYTYTMELGDTPSELWMLEMISNQRIPNIILTSGNTLAPFSQTEREFIQELALHLGRFHVPMFLHFLPAPLGRGYSQSDYVEFFRYARETFEYYAPQVAFVFTIGEGDALDWHHFYPGHEYVDWVGINIYKYIEENGTPFNEGTLGRLDAFYHSINRYKPIMVTFSVSHFSTINHIHHPLAAAQAIEDFYAIIPKYYPRVGAIIYRSINNISNPTIWHYRDNFSIIEDTVVMNSYISGVKYFDFTPDNYNLIRSPFTAISVDGKIFIPETVLLYDIGIQESYINSHLSPYAQELETGIYYNSELLEFLNINTTICNNGHIVLEYLGYS